MVDSFWKNKRVLLTGHTGFKGGWAALWLEAKGAEIAGISLAPAQDRCLYNIFSPWGSLRHHICDILDINRLRRQLRDFSPEIVIHLAAQALVRRSYRQPLETFATNIMGTVNLFQALLELSVLPRTILIITSDKVYRNYDSSQAFNEDDRLGGDDPYSASKACVELVTHSYRQSYFRNATQLASARAGNVIGGGDWSEDRLVPDIFRSIEQKTHVLLRNPQATRPWQHVLDVLNGYFSYIEALASQTDLPSALNFGPRAHDCATTADVVKMIGDVLGRGIPLKISARETIFREKQCLSLNAETAAKVLGWRPKLSVKEAVKLTADWYSAFFAGQDMRTFSLAQLRYFEELPYA